MEWPEYKRLCDEPSVLSRNLLELTAKAMRDEPLLKSRLSAQLNHAPVPKPVDHCGPPSADMFASNITSTEAHAIAAFIGKLPDSASAALGLSSLAGVRAAWDELADYLATVSQRDNRQRSTIFDEQHWGGVMSEVTVADNQQAVLDLVSAFNLIDVDAVMRCFHPEAVYHNIPVDPVSGVRSIRGVIESFTNAASEIHWEMINLSVTSEGHVMTERLDRFKINNRWISLPVMGVFEVADGLITCWRDYFDMEQFQSQLKATQS